MWLGPFKIAEIIGPPTFMLQNLTRKRESLPVNGQILKKYFPWEIILLFFILVFFILIKPVVNGYIWNSRKRYKFSVLDFISSLI